jgi:hypothetical protein
MKKKCDYCGIRTEDWEIVNGGPVRCWPCGKKIREAEDDAARIIQNRNRRKGIPKR